MRSPFSLRCSERCDVLFLCTAVPSPSAHAGGRDSIAFSVLAQVLRTQPS
jgi:hypothetical protein